VEIYGQATPGSFCYQFYNDKVVHEAACIDKGGVVHEGCPLKDVVARCKTNNDSEVIYYYGFDGVDCDG
jgi:DMSO/TMAO reductase YedYZ molybdopterin-dependent catalytic subunit